MATYILNKYQAVKFKLDPKQYNVLIRVTSPGEEFLKLENPDIYSEILEMEFFDFTDDSSGLKIFTEVELDAVVNFFEKHKFCQNLVVHCDLGVSRSAAIAVGWFLFTDNKASIYKLYHDNKHIPNRLIVTYFYKKFKQSMKHIEKWEQERTISIQNQINANNKEIKSNNNDQDIEEL